ncbi:hypothetical protein QJS04_geneDACA006010 [Acorus gramineus]|uniref:Uncharacterized protein n=1 Tax=Acorus gramineus TaxID=55184 RepID=A0AAV9B419_ACOGR|nr:hypothetical protein QJS04_geneDACA006011 [Acorus gramineus]KAK1270859.1 hypothetical protein QJS04_geneDACA006010 [Acorus gramineus]
MSKTLLPLLLLLSSLTISLAHPQPSSSSSSPAIVIEGMVYCQSCARAGSWSLTDSKNITSAKVGVACKDPKNRVRYYKSFQTDSNGYFYAELKGLDAALKDNALRACTVHLLSSADPHCNVPTNVNYGIYGAPLRDEQKRLYGKYYEAVIYAAGPFAFRPKVCVPKVYN